MIRKFTNCKINLNYNWYTVRPQEVHSLFYCYFFKKQLIFINSLILMYFFKDGFNAQFHGEWIHRIPSSHFTPFSSYSKLHLADPSPHPFHRYLHPLSSSPSPSLSISHYELIDNPAQLRLFHGAIDTLEKRQVIILNSNYFHHLCNNDNNDRSQDCSPPIWEEKVMQPRGGPFFLLSPSLPLGPPTTGARACWSSEPSTAPLL